MNGFQLSRRCWPSHMRRRGADVAISYSRTDEPDAREVTKLIKAAGRKAIPISLQ